MREIFLCASDVGPQAASLLRFALRLAAAQGAALVVLHVVELPDPRTTWYMAASRSGKLSQRRLLEKHVATLEQRLRQSLHEARAERSGVKVEAVVNSGRVVETVLGMALARDASLVILGKGSTRGELAPTAERVARQSTRPVVLVPVRRARAARVHQLRPQARPRRAAARAS